VAVVDGAGEGTEEAGGAAAPGGSAGTMICPQVGQRSRDGNLPSRMAASNAASRSSLGARRWASNVICDTKDTSQAARFQA
jgi:hypothetical protein